MAATEKAAEQAPSVAYQKRYDALSWHSADTDFEGDPLLSRRARVSRIQRLKLFCTRRTRKLTALILVVFIFLVIISGLVYLYYARNSPSSEVLQNIVMTDCGKVAGNIVTQKSSDTYKNVQCISYFAIPYARPPVGQLRWRPPVRLSENSSSCWAGTLHMHSPGVPCLQRNANGDIFGDEDCLTLTVLSPFPNMSASLLPVVVWISGYGLLSSVSYMPGYSPDCDFTVSMGAISVVINYRLGAFGFLTLKELWVENVSYGNYGIMDQILALKWIQANIQNFGGDPAAVTIIGHGSGGTSVYGLLGSPLSLNLFSKAIVLSGSALLGKSYVEASEDNRAFLHKARCSLNSSELIRSCLYSLNGTEIISAMPLLTFPCWSCSNIMDLPTKAVLGGALLVEDPIVLPPATIDLHSAENDNIIIPLIVGSTAQEIGMNPERMFVNDSWVEFRKFVSAKLDPFSSEIVHETLDGVYLNLSKVANTTVDMPVQFVYETMSSDIRMTCPTNNLCKRLAKLKSIRLFRYIVTNRPDHAIMLGALSSNNAAHMWDAIALFGFKYNQFGPYFPAVRDKGFMKGLRDRFRHFVLFGHMQDTDWVQYPDSTLLFVDNGIDILQGADYGALQCTVWEKYGFQSYSWIN